MSTTQTDWPKLDRILRNIKENNPKLFWQMQDTVEKLGARHLLSYGARGRGRITLLGDNEIIVSNAYEITRWMEISHAGRLGWGLICGPLTGQRIAGRVLG